jgi:hypothetical protein
MMSILEQMRRGMERLVSIDSDIGNISRAAKTDNGRGQLMPTGEALPSHKIICRVGYQSGGVWAAKPHEGGLTIDTSPFVLAFHDADLEQGDILKWRGKAYAVGVVTRPEGSGGATCAQAPLAEVE